MKHMEYDYFQLCEHHLKIVVKLHSAMNDIYIDNRHLSGSRILRQLLYLPFKIRKKDMFLYNFKTSFYFTVKKL